MESGSTTLLESRPGDDVKRFGWGRFPVGTVVRIVLGLPFLTAVAGPPGRAIALGYLGLGMVVGGAMVAANVGSRADAWSEYYRATNGREEGGTTDVRYAPLSMRALGAGCAVGGVLALDLALSQVDRHNPILAPLTLVSGALFFCVLVATIVGQMIAVAWHGD